MKSLTSGVREEIRRGRGGYARRDARAVGRGAIRREVGDGKGPERRLLHRRRSRQRLCAGTSVRQTT